MCMYISAYMRLCMCECKFDSVMYIIIINHLKMGGDVGIFVNFTKKKTLKQGRDSCTGLDGHRERQALG